MSVVVSSEEIGEKTEAILEELERVLEPDTLEEEPELALIVFQDWASLEAALKDYGVNRAGQVGPIPCPAPSI